MGQLIKNGVNYTGATGIIDGVGSTSGALALSANQGNKLANDMGAVELLDTAVNSYSVGQYFVWKSQFVKVTSAITAGDTIISGANVTPTNIGAVLAELNSNKEQTLGYYHSENIRNVTKGQSWFQTEYPYNILDGQYIVSAFADNPNVVTSFVWFNNKLCIAYYSSLDLTNVTFYYSILVRR